MLITFFVFDFRPIEHNSNLRQKMAYAPYFACIAYILRQKIAYVDFCQKLSGGVAK